MDHSYAESSGIIRIVDLYDLSILLDFTCFRLIQSEKNTHQCRLAGSVLPEKSMYLTLLKLERYVIIGHDSGKFLADVVHFNYIF